MDSLVIANPFRCRMWGLHDRLECDITEATCQAEIASFARHGQALPVLGRRLKGDPTHDIELIYGARRLFVARHLNLPLIVELREISDGDGIVAMHIENCQRRNVSSHERGVAYAKWLRAGHFKSQGDLARALGLSGARVSRLLRLAELPQDVVSAFANPADLCERWGLQLFILCEAAENRRAMTQEAISIAGLTQRPAPEVIYQRLLGSVTRRCRPSDHQSEYTVTSAAGDVLFHIKHRRKSVVVLLPSKGVTSRCMEAIEDAVSKAMGRTTRARRTSASTAESQRPTVAAFADYDWAAVAQAGIAAQSVILGSCKEQAHV